MAEKMDKMTAAVTVGMKVASMAEMMVEMSAILMAV